MIEIGGQHAIRMYAPMRLETIANGDSTVSSIFHCARIFPRQAPAYDRPGARELKREN